MTEDTLTFCPVVGGVRCAKVTLGVGGPAWVKIQDRPAPLRPLLSVTSWSGRNPVSFVIWSRDDVVACPAYLSATRKYWPAGVVVSHVAQVVTSPKRETLMERCKRGGLKREHPIAVSS